MVTRPCILNNDSRTQTIACENSESLFYELSARGRLRKHSNPNFSFESPKIDWQFPTDDRSGRQQSRRSDVDMYFTRSLIGYRLLTGFDYVLLFSMYAICLLSTLFSNWLRYRIRSMYPSMFVYNPVNELWDRYDRVSPLTVGYTLGTIRLKLSTMIW